MLDKYGLFTHPFYSAEYNCILYCKKVHQTQSYSTPNSTPNHHGSDYTRIRAKSSNGVKLEVW